MATEKQAKDIDYEKNVLGSVGVTQTVPHTGCSRSRGYTQLDTGKSYAETPKPRKENGLKVDCFTEGIIDDKPATNDYDKAIQAKSQIDIRKYHEGLKKAEDNYHGEILAMSGLESLKKEIPQITTLAEKAASGGNRQLLALAGMALKQQKTAFDDVYSDLTRLENLANGMLHGVSQMRSKVKSLEKLAVLNDIE